MLSSFNWADWAIIGVIVASSLISLLRGFVKEALSMLSWAVAFFVSIAFHDAMLGLLEPHISKLYVRDILAYILLFIGALVVGSLATHLIAQLVKRTGLSGTDRLLGMMFGTVRGLIVVLALLVVMPSLLAGIEQDPWWQESRLIPEFLVMQEWSEQTFQDLVNAVTGLISQHRVG